MNRLGLAAIGYTPDDKDIHPDEGNVSEMISRRKQRVDLFTIWMKLEMS